MSGLKVACPRCGTMIDVADGAVPDDLSWKFIEEVQRRLGEECQVEQTGQPAPRDPFEHVVDAFKALVRPRFGR
jgi:hypothetical protein